MHYFRILAAFAAVSCSMAAQAEIQAVPCNACTSDAQWEQRAWNLPPGKHYLYNFAIDEIRRYEKGPEGQVGFQGGGDVVVVRLPVMQSVENTFHATQEFWAVNNHRLDYHLEVPLDYGDPDFPYMLYGKTGYEIVGSTGLQIRLQNYSLGAIIWHYTHTTMPATSKVVLKEVIDVLQNAASGSFVEMVFGANPLEGDFEFILPNGSKIVIRYEGGEMTYAPTESLDRNGNPIPEPRPPFGLNYYFGFLDHPDGFQYWRDYVEHTLFWELQDGYYNSCIMVECETIFVDPPPAPLAGDEAGDYGKGVGSKPGRESFYNQRLSCKCVAWD